MFPTRLFPVRLFNLRTFPRRSNLEPTEFVDGLPIRVTNRDGDTIVKNRAPVYVLKFRSPDNKVVQQ